MKTRLHNPFAYFSKKDYLLWTGSMILILLANLLAGRMSVLSLATPVVGITAVILQGKGDVWGQILIVFFAVLYGIISWQFRYWGELATYLGMSAPIGVMAVVSWMKNPYGKDHSEVAISLLSARQKGQMWVLTALVTAVFYFLLKALDTPNLIPSTVSVATSFLASYLTWRRNSWYAAAYAANDLVLIVLWVLASLTDPVYVPVVANFAVFFLNDALAFCRWKRREVRQAVRVTDTAG